MSKFDECFVAAQRYSVGGTSSSKEGKKTDTGKMSKQDKMALWGAPGAGKDKKSKEVVREAYVERTPDGDKKLMDAEMAATYDPIAVESAWYSWWEKQGYFTPDAKKCKNLPEDKRFIMVIPPPNVTGALHVGHALTAAVEDALTRWHRMHGHATLWLPGVDHAGIATQSVVERLLYKNDKLTRHDLGREKFLEKVWEWKDKYGAKICQQFRTLAVSVDWSRQRFTMDEMCSKAVKESFVTFFEEGRIFRASRIVNWSCYLRTALSDLEVDHIEISERKEIHIPGLDIGVEVGVLCHFRYKIKGENEFITVATTRLETMLGDVAVAVHPSDERYKHLVGKKLEHPFVDREMVVVADDDVDKEFGTGCVKITPAHDPKDFQRGKRHNLPEINIFHDDGTLNEQCGEFAGQHRYVARRKVEEALKAKDLFDKKTNNEMKLGICSRSGDIIEPLTRPQWWMKCDDLAARCVDAVRNGDLAICPKFHENTWFHWLENIQDWCISRQLWWGHRIPAYKVVKPVQASECWIAAKTEEEALEKARVKLGIKDVEVEQDSDVLDTWYSSGLFPFSTMGWPDKTDDMEAFFPNSLLETGHDILFFWVARMCMMSFGLLDKLPFHTVYLHPMVRDAQGRKMSKSLGNALDPLELIYGCTLENLHAKLTDGNLPPKEVETAKAGQKKEFPKGIPACGSDAVRYGLLAYTAQGRSVNLDVNRVVGYRKFCNKLWNVVRFALQSFPEDFSAQGFTFRKLSFEDEWILHKLSECAEKSNRGFVEYQFADSVMATYAFWYDELAAVYLELLKPRLRSDDVSDVDKHTAREVLYACLDRGLRMLHPLLPFVTEELYQRLPPCHNKHTSIMCAEYPQEVIAWKNPIVETHMQVALDTTHGFRAKLSALGIAPGTQVAGCVRFESDVPDCVLSPIQVLSKLTSLRRGEDGEEERISEKCCIFVKV